MNMRYLQLTAMLDEMEKIANDGSWTPDVKKFQESLGLPAHPQGFNVPYPDLYDRVSIIQDMQEHQLIAQGRQLSHADMGAKPTFQRAITELNTYRKELSKPARGAGAILPSERMIYLGAADAAQEAVKKAVKFNMPKTVATIGGVVGGALLLNHLVKKYRDNQLPKKGF